MAKFYYVVCEYETPMGTVIKYSSVEVGDIMDIAEKKFGYEHTHRVIFYSEITEEQFIKHEKHFD